MSRCVRRAVPAAAGGLLALALAACGSSSHSPSAGAQPGTSSGATATAKASRSPAARPSSPRPSKVALARPKPPAPSPARPAPPKPASTRAATAAPPAVGALPPPPRGGVTALGDSVMIDAAPSLRALIPGIYIDAGVARQAESGIAALRYLAASGRLAGSVVVHMGTNGTFTADEQQRILQIVSGRHLVMVTGHCPYCSWTQTNNAVMYTGCTPARNCTIADWNALANRNPQWFGGDGVHMAVGGAGAQAYARLILQAL